MLFVKMSQLTWTDGPQQAKDQREMQGASEGAVQLYINIFFEVRGGGVSESRRRGGLARD